MEIFSGLQGRIALLGFQYARNFSSQKQPQNLSNKATSEPQQPQRVTTGGFKPMRDFLTCAQILSVAEN
jgi:hypothetical protein